jgi:hypothetical protein
MTADTKAARTGRAGLRGDVIGGLTTFFTMAYVIVVNPQILSTEGTGMPFAGVLTATVLTAATMTLLMGLYAKIPFAVAPGMGINAFFTYSIVLGQKVPWQSALGIIFWAGVIFLVISVTPVRVQRYPDRPMPDVTKPAETVRALEAARLTRQSRRHGASDRHG